MDSRVPGSGLWAQPACCVRASTRTPTLRCHRQCEDAHVHRRGRATPSGRGWSRAEEGTSEATRLCRDCAEIGVDQEVDTPRERASEATLRDSPHIAILAHTATREVRRGGASSVARRGAVGRENGNLLPRPRSTEPAASISDDKASRGGQRSEADDRGAWGENPPKTNARRGAVGRDNGSLLPRPRSTEPAESISDDKAALGAWGTGPPNN
jgi:hypothetical protein